MISMRWSFTAKKSLCTACWSLSRAAHGKTSPPVNNKGKSDAARGFRCSKEQLTPLGHAGPLESENEICCLTSLYWNPHFYRNVEDQGQTEPHSGGTWASDEHNPREFLSVKPYQSLWFPYWYNKIHWLCVFVMCVNSLSRDTLSFEWWI